MGQTQTAAKRLRGVVCTVLGGMCWGFSGSCGQYLFMNYGLDARWLTTVRMLCAGVILILVGLLQNRQNMKAILCKRRDTVQLVIFAVLGLVFSQYPYLMTISYSNAGTATVLQYTGPVLILIYVCIRTMKLPQKKEVAAIILALAGTFILATHGNIHGMVLTKQALLWGILSAVGLAAYTLLPVQLIVKYGSITVTGYGMLIGGIAMGLFVRVWAIPVRLDLTGAAAVAAMIIVGTVIAYTLYLKGVGEIGAAKASMLASVEPVTATAISVLWLHSQFGVMDAVGFAMILATVFLLAKKE